jgi:hypothetical protein
MAESHPIPTDAAQDIYCRGCRYPLRGLDKPRCPECGQSFDPNDPTTFLTLAMMRWAWQPIAAAVCLALLVLSPVLIYGGGRLLGLDRGFVWAMHFIQEVILGGACGVLAVMGMKRGSEKSRSLAAMVLFGLTIVFVLWLGFLSVLRLFGL